MTEWPALGCQLGALAEAEAETPNPTQAPPDLQWGLASYKAEVGGQLVARQG